jgi:serine/threonine protein kinase/Tol biopolymer transport system component
MVFSVGDRLGPYEITGAIGAGGMGEVYRARDQRLSRQVALKILPAAFSTDPDRIRRFEQEGRAAAAINHPNVVAIYDAGFDGGVFYVATELLEGETLRARLAGSPLPVRKAVEYAIQIARGLAAAHTKGILHRDLKPENLFVTKDGLVKILDFGLAKQLVTKQAGGYPSELSTEKILTNPGVVFGTTGYMSPEQIRGLLSDARSDLFSLGAVLYEMVSGKRPFSGESGVEVMNAILKQDPPDLDASLPPALERMICRCLEKKPEERFQSALDLAYALESITGTSSLSAERKVEAQALRRPYVRAIGVAAAFCFVLAAGFAARSWFLRPGSPSYQRVTYRRGVVENARFATGGRTIVYSASWDGNPYRLYSTQTQSPESRDLGLADAHLVSISKSDEMAVVLGGFSDPSRTVARAPISGGAPRKLADDIISADWAADGERLAVVRAKGGLRQLEFPIGHLLYQTAGVIYYPRISPKGDLIAFAEVPLGSFGFSLTGWVTTLDLNGNKKALTDIWLGGIGGIAWSPSGNEILFTAAPYGTTTSLYAVTRSGHQRLIAHLPGNFAINDVAPDGRILMTSVVYSDSLFFLPTLDAKEEDLYWHDLSVVADLSRDGKDLLFTEGGDATRTGEDWVTYLRSTSGSGAVRLGPGLPLEISPDGKWALVLGSSRAPSQLMLLPTGAGQTRPLTHEGIHHQGAAWTPDGKRMVFVGNEPGHQIRYYVQSLDGAPPRAITPENVSFNFWVDPVVVSPDGRLVAAAGLGGKIVLYPLDGGAPREIPKLVDGSEPLRWCPDSSLLVYHSGTIPLKITRTDIETGKQTVWKELQPSNRTGLYSILGPRVRVDCKSLAYTVLYEPSELWVADGLR